MRDTESFRDSHGMLVRSRKRAKCRTPLLEKERNKSVCACAKEEKQSRHLTIY